MAHVKQVIARVKRASQPEGRKVSMVVTMRIPEDEYRALQKEAQAEERPFSNFVRTVLRRELKRRRELDGGGDAAPE